MRRAIAVVPSGAWREEERVGTVTLAYDDRHRRRLRMTDDAGGAFLLDLGRPARLGEGDGLRLEGGGIIAVRAAVEPVLEVQGADPAATARLAWHLGNRHALVQVLPDGTLRLRRDPVLADMLQGLGARVRNARAPFAPEPGAYAGRAATADEHAHEH